MRVNEQVSDSCVYCSIEDDSNTIPLIEYRQVGNLFLTLLGREVRLVDEATVHLGIAVHTGHTGKALLLDLPGTNDALADDGTRLTGLLLGHLLKGHGDDLYLQVDAVEYYVVTLSFEYMLPPNCCFSS